MHILLCTINNQRYGFDLQNVERSILAVECTSLPQAPTHVLGVINFHGQVIPVVNMHSLLGLPSRDLGVDDHFVICRQGEQVAALWVDHVQQVRSYEESQLIPAKGIVANMDLIRWAFKEGDTITLIFDLEKIISSLVVGTRSC